MKNNKKTIILSVVAIVTFAILIVGATYAYFTAQIGDGKRAEINVTTYTTDVLTFATGDAINLEADQTTFGKDKGSVSGATYASAVLTANNKTNKAVEHYYLYLNIENNTFTYSVQDNKPELIMTITDKDGNEVKNIEGLTYTEVTDRTNKKISGYDITTKSGLVTIFNNREIIAEPKAEDKWNITITFVNYEADQNANTGKVLSAKLMIQKKAFPLHETCKDKTLACHVAKLYTGTQGENNIYYHNGTLENGINDNSYRYAGGESCTFDGENVQGAYSNATFGASNEIDCQKVYTIKSDAITLWLDNSITRLLSDEKPVTWTDGACKTMDGESVNIGFVNVNFKSVTEATCKGNSYLVKTDALTARVANLNMEYVGVGTWKGINNYVCFGSNESPCPTDNLYRIIGVIDEKVKLIKYDYATSDLLGKDGDYKNSYKEKWPKGNSFYKGSNYENIASYSWNDATRNNTWSESNLNKTNLNTNFINNIGKEWAEKIAETTWKVGGNTDANIEEVIPSVVYQNEILNPMSNTTDSKKEYKAKIGLMYVSDYGFAADPSAWTMTLGQYGIGSEREKNWMYMGLFEWTISRTATVSDGAFSVFDDGGHLTGGLVDSDGTGVRPSFSLSFFTAHVSGSGSAIDPFLITY